MEGERYLEEAESVLADWATILADESRDGEAGECLRVRGQILKLRCSFLESEKRP
jgi:DNA-binding transcriptional LysR family regulator